MTCRCCGQRTARRLSTHLWECDTCGRYTIGGRSATYPTLRSLLAQRAAASTESQQP